MKWNIEYDSDTSPCDEGFYEWWTVTDGVRYFRCDKEGDANWLCDLLNREDGRALA